jgi:hypothetical protein
MEQKEAVLLTEIIQLLDAAIEKVTQLNGADTHANSQAVTRIKEAKLWSREAAKK